MGRYYYHVHSTTLAYLKRTRQELNPASVDRLAHEFAAAYVRAAYANAEMIESTIRTEGIDCHYERRGWVQVQGPDSLARLAASAAMARETGFTDWTEIPAAEAFERTGMRTGCAAGFSAGAATWHPAKWVWGLMRIALQSPHVQLFTRTQVNRVDDEGECYAVHTGRGVIRARFVINATESATPLLFPRFHDRIRPMQTQAAWGESDGGTMKRGIGISNDRGFFGRLGDGVLFGSDATRVPDHEVGRNQPSRFITRYLISELRARFQARSIRVTNEWSGTVSYTPDEFPIVGLMDEKRLYMVGGMAGSGSGVSFNGARHVVARILGLDGPDYYPEKYFSPQRFFSGVPANRIGGSRTTRQIFRCNGLLPGHSEPRAKPNCERIKPVMKQSRRGFLSLGGAALAAGAFEPGMAAETPGDLKLGVASYTLREFSRAHAIRLLKKLGTSYVNIKEFHLPYRATQEDLVKGRADFDKAGLKVLGGGTIYMLKNDEADVRFYFDYARTCGMPLMVVGPSAEALPLIEKMAIRYDIKIAIHNHGPEDKHMPTPQSALKLIKNMDPRMGLCIDIGHTTRTGTDVVEAIAEAGPRLLDMHVKDLRDLMNKDSQCAVGEGKMPIVAIFKQLKKMNYQGAVMLEYEIEGDNPLPGMMKSFAYMHGVQAGLRG